MKVYLRLSSDLSLATTESSNLISNAVVVWSFIANALTLHGWKEKDNVLARSARLLTCGNLVHVLSSVDNLCKHLPPSGAVFLFWACSGFRLLIKKVGLPCTRLPPFPLLCSVCKNTCIRCTIPIANFHI